MTQVKKIIKIVLIYIINLIFQLCIRKRKKSFTYAFSSIHVSIYIYQEVAYLLFSTCPSLVQSRATTELEPGQSSPYPYTHYPDRPQGVASSSRLPLWTPPLVFFLLSTIFFSLLLSSIPSFKEFYMFIYPISPPLPPPL